MLLFFYLRFRSTKAAVITANIMMTAAPAMSKVSVGGLPSGCGATVGDAGVVVNVGVVVCVGAVV